LIINRLGVALCESLSQSSVVSSHNYLCNARSSVWLNWFVVLD